VSPAFIPLKEGAGPITIAKSVEQVLEIDPMVRNSKVDQLVKKYVIEDVLGNAIKAV
jgi:hypothetical protein